MLKISAFTPVLFLAGLLVARAALPRNVGDESDATGRTVRLLSVSLGWGFGVIPSLAFFFHLFTGVRVAWWNILLAALVNGAAAVWVLHRRDPLKQLPELLFPAGRLRQLVQASAPVLLAVSLVGGVYFLKHDNRQATIESCIYATACIATEGVATRAEPYIDRNLLTENIEDARLGNTGVLSGFLALYGRFGFRILHCMCGMMCALGGWMIGSRVGGGRPWGWFGLFLLPLNPYVLNFPQVDENLLTLAFSTSVLPMVAVGGAYAVTGALFGLVVTMRHVMIPALAGMILVARGGRVRFIVAFVLMTFTENLHHLLALGSLFRNESLTQYPTLQYDLLGFDFQWSGMLNWPFYEHVVRTPHNPFPTFVLWPLYLVDNLGLILFSLMIIGFLSLWWRSRRQAAFWALWSIATIAVLAVQESWDQLNKMGVLVIVFGAFISWIVAGTFFIMRRYRLGIPLLASVMALSWCGVRVVRDWRPPADERYQNSFHSASEDSELVKEEALRETDIGILPDFGRLNRWGGFIDLGKIRDIPLNLAAPTLGWRNAPWGWFPGEPPEPGRPVTIELDLSRRLHGRIDIIKATDRPAEFDLISSKKLNVISGIRVPWTEHELTVYSGRSDSVTGIHVFLGDESAPENVIEERFSMYYALAGLSDERPEKVERSSKDSPRLRFRVPSGALSIALEINIVAERILLWKGLVSPTGVSLREPVEPWHN